MGAGFSVCPSILRGVRLGILEGARNEKKNGGRVARGEVARDDGLEHSRRVEEAQEEGVDPEEETQHGDRPLRSRADAEVSEWKGSRTRGLFSFPREEVQIVLEKPKKRLGREPAFKADLEIFLFGRVVFRAISRQHQTGPASTIPYEI